MSTFRVVRAERVIVCRDVVVCETDDPLEAESVCFRASPTSRVRIEGVHPSHDWKDGRCTSCRAYDNGCFASHMPCGYEHSRSIYDEIVRWETTRAATSAGSQVTVTRGHPAGTEAGGA